MMRPYVVTRDKAGHWIAAELLEGGVVGGTVVCRRLHHRLRVHDDAPRSAAVRAAMELAASMDATAACRRCEE